MQGGPQLSWAALRDFQHCEGNACDVFRSRNPSTVSMSVLVVVEMFNALNALSGEQGACLAGVWKEDSSAQPLTPIGPGVYLPGQATHCIHHPPAK